MQEDRDSVPKMLLNRALSPSQDDKKGISIYNFLKQTKTTKKNIILNYIMISFFGIALAALWIELERVEKRPLLMYSLKTTQERVV